MYVSQATSLYQLVIHYIVIDMSIDKIFTVNSQEVANSNVILSVES